MKWYISELSGTQIGFLRGPDSLLPSCLLCRRGPWVISTADHRPSDHQRLTPTLLISSSASLCRSPFTVLPSLAWSLTTSDGACVQARAPKWPAWRLTSSSRCTRWRSSPQLWTHAWHRCARKLMALYMTSSCEP